MRHLPLAFVLVFAGTMRGQDKDVKDSPPAKGTHEGYAQESLKVLEKLADTLAEVRDPKSVADARVKLGDLKTSLAALRRQVESLGEPTREQRTELDKKYRAKFEAAIKRFRDEAVRVATSVEGGKAMLEEFDKLIRPLTDKKK
jgi:hypothetical protein